MIYESTAFTNWKKVRDHDLKMQGAIIERLDGVAAQIGALGKLMRGFGNR